MTWRKVARGEYRTRDGKWLITNPLSRKGNPQSRVWKIYHRQNGVWQFRLTETSLLDAQEKVHEFSLESA